MGLFRKKKNKKSLFDKPFSRSFHSRNSRNPHSRDIRHRPDARHSTGQKGGLLGSILSKLGIQKYRNAKSHATITETAHKIGLDW